MILQIQSEKDEPNSGTSYKSSIFNFYPQNLLKPDSNPQWINVLYQEHIQYKMLIGKSRYFQVNIPWDEPQSSSWSKIYTSTSFRFIYIKEKQKKHDTSCWLVPAARTVLSCGVGDKSRGSDVLDINLYMYYMTPTCRTQSRRARSTDLSARSIQVAVLSAQ